MKTAFVDSIVSNDQHVRLQIFDGDIPADKYWQEIARLEKGQRAAERARFLRTIAALQSEIGRLSAP